ncbi:MAG: Ig domain-containing protein, partial [bacterium]|nr:Ig domain-containing protein [bacterium]
MSRLVAGAVAVIVGAVAALAAAVAPAAAAYTCASGSMCVTVIVDNQNTSVPAAGNTLYLTLTGTGGTTTLIDPSGTSHAMNTSVPFSTFQTGASGPAQFTVQTQSSNPLASGRLYFSEADLSGSQPAPNGSFRYDYVEFTIVNNSGVLNVNGDVTGIDQVGIPSSMSFQDANGNTLNNSGTSLPATRSMGCWTTILNAITTASSSLDPAWTPSSIAQSTAAGTRLRLAGPIAMPAGIASYPSMQSYVQALGTNTVTLSGTFAGNTKLNILGSPYSYSGTFDKWGNIALSGTLGPNYPTPQTIYIPARSLYDTMAPNGNWSANSWGNAAVGYGTGFGVYAQNGPYQLGGTAPSTYETATTGGAQSWALSSSYVTNTSVFFESIGNDVYGWIYGDLVASMANGFVGPLGYNSSAWNTNPPTNAAPQPAFAAAYTSQSKTVPTYAAWDLWQNAVATTSDSYGVSLGDRFNFQGAHSSSPDMSTSVATGIIRVTLLPNDGCTTSAALAPPVQSLILSTGEQVKVLPAALQPPQGVNNDFVTLTGQGFTPRTFTIAPSLPAGLVFNANTGVVSGGTKTSMAKTAFTITGTSGQQTASATLNITVGTRAITPAAQSLTGTINQALTPSLGFTATGFSGTPSYSISPSLPAGLTINASSGIISGTPQQSQPATSYTVTASGQSGSASATVTITVKSPRAISPATQQVSGTVGTAITPTQAYVATGFASGPTYSASLP